MNAILSLYQIRQEYQNKLVVAAVVGRDKFNKACSFIPIRATCSRAEADEIRTKGHEEGIDTIIIPVFEQNAEVAKVTVKDGDVQFEVTNTPASTAQFFRDYYGM